LRGGRRERGGSFPGKHLSSDECATPVSIETAMKGCRRLSSLQMELTQLSA
jgi:hypothetical protein